MARAKLQGLRLSENEVSQTIDFKEAFGVDLSKNEALKQRIGQAIIDRIIERNEQNKSVEGGNLKTPYSKSYAKSKKFELYGKSRGDVNMKLTGDMLSSVDISETRGNQVKIELDQGQAPKGYNHHTGDTVPRRPWFGVNKKELNEIKREFKNELRQVKEGKEEVEQRQEQAQVEQERLDLATIRALAQGERQTTSALDALIGNLFGESED